MMFELRYDFLKAKEREREREKKRKGKTFGTAVQVIISPFLFPYVCAVCVCLPFALYFLPPPSTTKKAKLPLRHLRPPTVVVS